MRLIDADTLKMTTLTKWNGDVEFIVYKKDIDEAQTIKCEKQTDSALDKNKAEWIREHSITYSGSFWHIECSNCHKESEYLYDFCPNCGSRMKEVEE